MQEKSQTDMNHNVFEPKAFIKVEEYSVPRRVQNWCLPSCYV